MPDAPDLGFAVRQPPEEVIKYFRAKGYEVSWNWWETWEAAHARAFTVAKATRLDVLSSIRGALDRAIESGLTRREFARELEPTLVRLGWWGRRLVAGPGGVEKVQLGSPHRLRTIFDTNLRTAYGAARYREQADNADSRPYWQYDARNDDRVRPSHAALDGAVFRHDDPFWHTHYPPNGWNCRCRVRALTAAQVRARGINVSDSRGHMRRVQQQAGIDKRTGEIIERPGTEYRFRAGGEDHVLLPDAGWSYNPGLAGPGGPQIPGPIGPVVGGATWRTWDLPERLPPRAEPPRLPPARDAAAVKAQIHRAVADAAGAGQPLVSITRPDGTARVVFGRVRTPTGDDVMLTEDFIDHVAKGEREQFANLILPTLRDPDEIWMTSTERAGRVVYRRQFIAAYEGRAGFVVAQEDPYGWLAWTFYPIKDHGAVNKRRKGSLLYRREETPAED